MEWGLSAKNSIGWSRLWIAVCPLNIQKDGPDYGMGFIR